jgi:hypothetical protein
MKDGGVIRISRLEEPFPPDPINLFEKYKSMARNVP